LSKIKILSENLANQIAAGEVVERPASVVKELLENALDAGASHISVEVEGGGTRLIRIIDDGEGMDQDDVLLSLERHATSKLASAEQLAVISTLGFRGEAIPSISSVSKMIITSRPSDSPLGTRAEIRFGQLQKVHEMGCAPGTIMEVKDLFGNVPARRKFLKTSATEVAHITEIVKNYALVRYGVGFSYRVDGRVVFETSTGTDTLEERVRILVAPAGSRQLIPMVVDNDTENPEMITVTGYLVPPDEGSSSVSRLRIFVNGRAVRDRMINHAVAEGLHGYLMKGRGPHGTVFIDLPPQHVDVNVHPTKQEVRFIKSQSVHDRVVASVRQAMQNFQQDVRQALFHSSPEIVKNLSKPTSETIGIAQTWQQTKIPASLMVNEKKAVYGRMPEPRDAVRAETSPTGKVEYPGLGYGNDSSLSEISEVSPNKQSGNNSVLAFSPETVAPNVIHEEIGTLRIIGQLFDSYILCDTGEDFVIIDQHAAHERLLFEDLKAHYADRTLASQSLLFPKVIECGPAEIQVLDRYRDEIARMGLDIAEFGGGSYVIKGVPAVMGQLPPEEILAGIIAQFSDEQATGGAPATRIDNILASMACKAAVKANRRLDESAMTALLQSMRKANAFSHCPHGRPVVKHISQVEIAKWFRRT